MCPPSPRLLAALALVLAATVACGDAVDVAADRAAAVGTYSLASVDGCAVGTPAEQCPFPRRSWIVDGTMVLRADGSATRTMLYQFPADAAPRTLLMARPAAALLSCSFAA